MLHQRSSVLPTTTWVLCILLWLSAESLATSAASDTPPAAVPAGSRCPDGRIPLNSLEARCQSQQPRLQWAGLQCDSRSRSFGCPSNFSCLASGLCCEETSPPNQFRDNLCLENPSTSNVVEAVGSCASSDDCQHYDSPKSKCCGGRCYLLRQRCFQRLQEYLSIQSTGRMPRQYMPTCTDDGAFAPVQSEPRLGGLRWCVDPRTGLALRSGCCLSDVGIAANGSSGRLCANLRHCPRDLCAMRVCPAQPDARCRIDPCGGCRVEFVDSAGRPVDCTAGVSQCQAKAFEYYAGLAYLRTRDQTQWIQTVLANKPVTSNPGLNASTDTCQSDRCVAYDASKLEPGQATSGWPSGHCPHQDQLGYHCGNRCGYYGGCDKSRPVCCNSGCGLECMRPADIAHEAKCRMSVSSGHCPALGCHRMCRRWGYDTARRRCRPFWYAGSGGNNNRYGSFAECEWAVQNCHGRVWLALPWKPACDRGGGGYGRVQVTDNGMFWCVNRAGQPTPGSLHAAHIQCDWYGRLIINRYYKKKNAALYKARCPSGAWPSWCHNLPADRACGSPGIATFADACNGCRLVHVNADGEEVACRADADACAAAGGCESSTSTSPSQSAPTFAYSAATGRCDQCGGGDHRPAATVGYSRESGCLAACAAARCPPAASFYPDLCVSPACRWPGAVCQPDECSGLERYRLPNGTEAVDCARRLQPLDLASLADCGAKATTMTATTKTAGTTFTPGIGCATSAANSDCSTATTKTGGGGGGGGVTTTVKAAGGTTPTTKTDASGSTTTSVTTVDTTATTKTAAAAATSTTSLPPAPKALLPICRIRSHLGVETLQCRASDGKYEPRQCNASHCFCVVIDTGAALANGSVVPVAEAGSLACPIVETTNLSLAITYDADYLTILPTAEREAMLQREVIRKFSYEARLQASHFQLVDLEPGSIVVTVGLAKPPGDASADLPASSFELKTMALKQTLTLDIDGTRLTPSTRQDFNEQSASAVVQQPLHSPIGTAGSAELSVGGIVAGVLITVIVVAVAGVLIAFALRRRSLAMGGANLPHESGDYETMSNGSQATGSNAGYDNFANKVYAPAEDVYDNIAQPASSA